jgi:hypothetical protein
MFDVDWVNRCGAFESDKVISTYLRWKVWRKEEQKNWTVKHKLCYWMSNEPRITADFLQNAMNFQIYW